MIFFAWVGKIGTSTSVSIADMFLDDHKFSQQLMGNAHMKSNFINRQRFWVYFSSCPRYTLEQVPASLICLNRVLLSYRKCQSEKKHKHISIKDLIIRLINIDTDLCIGQYQSLYTYSFIYWLIDTLFIDRSGSTQTESHSLVLLCSLLHSL